MRRSITAAAAAGLLATAALAQDAAVLIERLTGPSSGLEKNLRVLTDEIGGRVTGSAGYEKALVWGVKAFERAGVDSVKLESYPVPARWEAPSRWPPCRRASSRCARSPSGSRRPRPVR